MLSQWSMVIRGGTLHSDTALIPDSHRQTIARHLEMWNSWCSGGGAWSFLVKDLIPLEFALCLSPIEQLQESFDSTGSCTYCKAAWTLQPMVFSVWNFTCPPTHAIVTQPRLNCVPSLRVSGQPQICFGRRGLCFYASDITDWRWLDDFARDSDPEAPQSDKMSSEWCHVSLAWSRPLYGYCVEGSWVQSWGDNGVPVNQMPRAPFRLATLGVPRLHRHPSFDSGFTQTNHCTPSKAGNGWCCCSGVWSFVLGHCILTQLPL